MTPGCAAGGAAVNGDGRAPARRRSWRAVELLLATLVLFVVAVGAGATAAHADWDSDQQHGSGQQQGSDQQQDSRSQTADEGQFLGLANGQRNSVGSGALTADSGLRDIARWWAARMAASSDIFHNYNLPNEVHDDWSKLGENVGMGWSVDDLHKAFVKSQTHYENLVDPSYGSVGVGVAYNSDGKIFVVFDFMALQPPAGTPAPPQPNAQAGAGDGMTLVRPRVAAAAAPPPVAHPVTTPPAPVLPAVLVEEDPGPEPAPVPPPAPPRAPSPALTGVLTELRALDHHAAAPRARATATSTSTTTTTIKRARRGSREATVETKDAQTWTKPKPTPQKADQPTSPSEAAKLWMTPSYCDPKHPKGSC